MSDTTVIITAVMYLVIGLIMGLVQLINYLPRFHGAGFQWKRMFWFVVLWTFLWPIGVSELIKAK